MIEYVLCYATSFTLGALFGGSIILLLNYNKNHQTD